MTPFFLGHHKGGTRFIGGILESFAAHAGIEYVTLNNPKWFGYSIRNALQGRSSCVVNYMNADHRFLDEFNDYRGFHVVRDPRDIGVSAYYSHLYSHGLEWWPELAPHRARLESLSFSAGLLCDLEFTDLLMTDGYPVGVFCAMDRWCYDDPNILELKFEDIISSPVDQLTAAFAFIGLLNESSQRDRDILRELIDRNRFEMLSGGRQPGEVDDRHHYRSGRPGEWKTNFDESHVQWFKTRYPNLLTQLGYERSNNW